MKFLIAPAIRASNLDEDFICDALRNLKKQRCTTIAFTPADVLLLFFNAW